MSAEFNSDLLLLARQYRGRSQAEVAMAAKLDQGHYSRIERDLLNAPPSEDTIETISAALDFPVEFFFQDLELGGLPLSIHGPAWRKRASTLSSDIKRLHAELNLRAIHLKEFLNSVDFKADLVLPQLDVDECGGAAAAARLVRRAWSIPDAPIKSLTKYCERAGILVAHCDFPEKIDGVTMHLRGLPPTIFLNQNAPADRMRHSLAHELGHIILHRIPTDTMEDEADTFAGELLAPYKMVCSELIGGRVTLERLVQQKLYWRVSVASLLYKLGKNDFLTENQSGYLWRQISARGWRKSEPLETQFPKEVPSLYQHLVTLHTKELGYTKKDLAKLLRLNGSDLSQLYSVEDQQATHLRVIK